MAGQSQQARMSEPSSVRTKKLAYLEVKLAGAGYFGLGCEVFQSRHWENFHTELDI